MRRLLALVSVVAALCVFHGGPLALRAAASGCCKICKSSCACGDSCISCSKTCRVGPGCACNDGGGCG